MLTLLVLVFRESYQVRALQFHTIHQFSLPTSCDDQTSLSFCLSVVGVLLYLQCWSEGRYLLQQDDHHSLLRCRLHLHLKYHLHLRRWPLPPSLPQPLPPSFLQPLRAPPSILQSLHLQLLCRVSQFTAGGLVSLKPIYRMDFRINIAKFLAILRKKIARSLSRAISSSM